MIKSMGIYGYDMPNSLDYSQSSLEGYFLASYTPREIETVENPNHPQSVRIRIPVVQSFTLLE